ncbi:hypothetical protein [Flagellimonas chongwuensis]|uniref:hypothetical protein n=1 Tax=Flagellimonas chongwuensis TaxID=2697365 RepID=UPI001E5C65C6|nr:hypothetical protein [Allomuricauda chongwuensis]
MKIKEEFTPLAKWIDEKYDVKTLNLVFDFIKNDKSYPRLQVCLEYVKDKGKFMDNQTYSFDKTKQNEVSDKFAEIVSGYNIKNRQNWIKKIFGLTYKPNNLFVYFSDFESIAKIEANENIPEKKIKELKTAINNSELWEIDRRFDSVTYFLHTEEQLIRYQNSEIHKKWNQEYFDLLKDYDEFGYFIRESYSVFLDSKENFDKNYESNWFYYYK